MLPLASIGECEMPLPDAEAVFARWGVDAGSVIYPEAVEEDDPCLPGTVSVLDWTPGALFSAHPSRGFALAPLIDRVGGCIRGLFRFSSETPMSDRQKVAEESFNLWKCHVAAFLLEKEKESGE
jgi:hypothetical protein